MINVMSRIFIKEKFFYGNQRVQLSMSVDLTWLMVSSPLSPRLVVLILVVKFDTCAFCIFPLKFHSPPKEDQ